MLKWLKSSETGVAISVVIKAGELNHKVNEFICDQVANPKAIERYVQIAAEIKIAITKLCKPFPFFLKEPYNKTNQSIAIPIPTLKSMNGPSVPPLNAKKNRVALIAPIKFSIASLSLYFIFILKLRWWAFPTI
jgi:hypothetical protein